MPLLSEAAMVPLGVGKIGSMRIGGPSHVSAALSQLPAPSGPAGQRAVAPAALPLYAAAPPPLPATPAPSAGLSALAPANGEQPAAQLRPDASLDVGDIALDLTQLVLDVTGIVDPTPLSDGANAAISVGRGDWGGAAISLVSAVVPYVGDLAKAGKLPRLVESLGRIADSARADPKAMQALRAPLEALRAVLDRAPLDRLPEAVREPLRALKCKVDEALGSLSCPAPPSAPPTLSATVAQADPGGPVPREIGNSRVPDGSAPAAPSPSAEPVAGRSQSMAEAGSPPRLMITAGPATTHSQHEIGHMHQPDLWRQRERWHAEVDGDGQRQFQTPFRGRRPDVVVEYGSGKFLAAHEIKSYQPFITRNGVDQRNEVGLNGRLQAQIDTDVWLRANPPNGYEMYTPLWVFTDAPPSQVLKVALHKAGIPFVEIH
jgi:hypothetical protein